tara:strand:- start:660 stop:1091 length:432 start_codon:yes stop_codon:yes gene_type:complete
MSNEPLEQKYLKLLKEYEDLREKKTLTPQKQSMPVNNACEIKLHACSNSHRSLKERKDLLQEEVIDLYKQWIPPKVSSFFKTLIPWIKKGFKKSQFSEYRLDICKKCPYLRDNTTCKICGCFMKRKVNIPQASCPLKKWTPEK